MRRRFDRLRVSWFYFRQLRIDYIYLRLRFLRLRAAETGFGPRLRRNLIWIVGLGLIAYLILVQGYRTAWTGFADSVDSQANIQRGKKLWDWMELLIVPIALAAGAYYLTRNERRKERERTLDRQRELALQTYYDRLSALLLESNLLHSSEGSEVRTVAQARTLTVLRGLDGHRKGLVIRFLFESGLIDRFSPIISLYRADLSGVDLVGMELSKSNLHGANLDGANLYRARLYGSDLGGCTIVGADLTSVDLMAAHLEYTRFDKSTLYGASLRSAKLGIAKFVDSDLEGANLRDAKVFRADLTGANLRKARLSNADLYRSDLVDTNLTRADLSGANLTEATMRRAKLNQASLAHADLTGAWVNWRQLRKARTLKGATLKGLREP